MPIKTKDKPRKKSADKTLNMKDPELFGKIDRVFEGRKASGMALLNQVRLALTEWCEANGVK